MTHHGGRHRARIAAIGSFVPERAVSNAELARFIDTSDEWIRSRTGIQQRHVADPGVATSQLACRAARAALERADLAPESLDLILVATVTPDMPFPATACLVQELLGARGAWGFDLSAACSGFLYALSVGAQFIETGRHRRVLVIGADVMSSVAACSDRATSILFGDGAGAVLLEPSTNGAGLIDFVHEVDGRGAAFLCVPAGGSARPTSAATLAEGLHCVKQDGPQVYRFAVRKLVEASCRLLTRNGLSPRDVDLFVAHQGNARIIDAAAERLAIPPDRVVKNIHCYGNTAAASIPLALSSALAEGRLDRDQLVLMTSVGAGFTAGAALLRWSAEARPQRRVAVGHA
jgi:3-oxoacyl-[acyl-carrier-protein] synthase III